jgi:hypothetical protein
MYIVKAHIDMGQYYEYHVHPSYDNEFTVSKWINLSGTKFVFRETYSKFNEVFNLKLPNTN